MGQLIALVVGLLAAGAVTGMLAGVFGVGGGAIIVPVLYELFRLQGVPEDVRMPLAVGTSLAVIIPTSIRSFRAHQRKGAVDMSILKAWALPVVLGVIGGSFVARYAPPDLFKIVFVIVAGASAIRLLFGRDFWKLGDTMPGGIIMKVYGLLIGVLSALMGIGGGQLSNLFMTLLWKADPPGRGDVVGAWRAHLDPRRGRLCLCGAGPRWASCPPCCPRSPSATSR